MSGLFSARLPVMSGEMARFEGRRRVVVAFPLKTPVRTRLIEAAGPDVELIDIKDSDGSEDLVVVPSVSRQLMAKLRSAFHRATVLVVEVEDSAHGLGFAGPITRALDAGADGYYVADSLEQFARFLSETAPGRSAPDPPARELSAPEQQLSDLLDVILRQRQAQPDPED